MNADLISRNALLGVLRHLDDEPGDMMSDEYFEWGNMSAFDMLDKVLGIVRAFPSAHTSEDEAKERVINDMPTSGGS